jgi:ABC-2 type transport system ATP-binding protein
VRPPAVIRESMPPPAAAGPLIEIDRLGKRYANGFVALEDASLAIREGEILALLGPNGAGKTTLISIVCGIVNPTSGHVRVAGFDVIRDYRQTRSLIGLVPQELTTDAFETVTATVNLSRGLYGKPADAAVVERVLRDLSLWDKRDSKIMTLSGGMKRRVLIAKALVHEPRILFLDEPTAGVDVELRKDMWRIVERLREGGVTIILTTHYIEEAEAIADRVAVINGGRIVLVQDKRELMQQLGRKQLMLELVRPLASIPQALGDHDLALGAGGQELVYTFSKGMERGIERLLADLAAHGIAFRDLRTRQSSLEDIFVGLVHRPAATPEPARAPELS